MSWATLFERAADRETTLDDVRAALSRRRESREAEATAPEDETGVENR